jgi:hypothetical protein
LGIENSRIIGILDTVDAKNAVDTMDATERFA